MVNDQGNNDKETAAQNLRANLVGLIQGPRNIFDDAKNHQVAFGLKTFEMFLGKKAEDSGMDITIVSGIDGRKEKSEPDLFGLFALGMPRNRDEVVTHKYVVCYGYADTRFQRFKYQGGNDLNIFVVGCPTSLLGFHREIYHKLGECLSQHFLKDLKITQGGFYDFPSLKVHGKSEDYGEFPYPLSVQSLLHQLSFHDQLSTPEEYEEVKRQVRRILAFPREERNQEILRRVKPWAGFLAGKQTQVPLAYKRERPFPDMHLICYGSYDQCHNLMNMGYNLGLQYGVDKSKIAVKYTGELDPELRDSLNIVALNDLTGQALKGSPVSLSLTIGDLHKMGLLTSEAEEFAISKMPEAIDNFIAQQESNRGYRDMRFNEQMFLEELRELRAYDAGLEAIKSTFERERNSRKLSLEEERWYFDVIKKYV